MFAEPVAYHDVADVEAFMRALAKRRVAQFGGWLDDPEFEELVATLIVLAWELQRSYNCELGLSYSTFLYRTARLRVVDFYRARFGDARYGAKPDTVTDPMSEQFTEHADPRDTIDRRLDRMDKTLLEQEIYEDEIKETLERMPVAELPDEDDDEPGDLERRLEPVLDPNLPAPVRVAKLEQLEAELGVDDELVAA